MTDKEIIEKMAGIEGYERIHLDGYNWRNKRGETIPEEHEHSIMPDYLNSHDAVQRVVDGFSNEEIIMYWHELWAVVGNEYQILKATPRQKAEAVLKALGLWRDE